MIENNFSKSLQKRRFFEYDIFKQISAQASNIKYIQDHFTDLLCEVERVEWIYDLPDKVDRAPVSNSAVTKRLLALMKDAESDVVIQSPYVVLSSDIQNAFTELKQKRNDVSVVISTNSLAATDN